MKPWYVIPKGGPAGPFYGIIEQGGRIVATQVVTEADAEAMCTNRRDAEVLRGLTHILSGHVGETGATEGAQEVLERIMQDHIAAQHQGP